MDKETKVAYEIVRQRIVERLDTLYDAQQAGVKLPSGDINSLKKWRRFGAAFAWDPEVFQNVLEKPGMPDQQLISELRKAETQLMRKWGVIDKIPLHHVVANRTGGDLGIRTPVDTWLETRKRIFDATGAKPGDGPSNLNAASQFDELAHLGRTGAKGSVFADTGIQQRADFPVLHRAGQNLAAKAGEDPKLVLGTAEEQAEVLIPSVEQQQARFAETTATPEVQAQRQVLTKAGYPEAFAADTPIERIQEIAKEIRGTEIPKQFATAFDFSGGTVRLTTRGLGGLLPVVGVGFDVLDAKEKTERAAKTGAPLDKLQAGIAQVTAATSPIPEPVSQGINFVGGAVNFVIDALRTPSAPVTDEDLEFSTM
tara:strand:- start:155 stop:1261 length:1107 start_codon:yes stop_codon:yes gene_type:complete